MNGFLKRKISKILDEWILKKGSMYGQFATEKKTIIQQYHQISMKFDVIM